MTERRRREPVDILLVEDNPGDVRLTEEAFAEASLENNLKVVRDGQAALDFVYRRNEHADAPRPNLILLDLNLPKVHGFDVLEEIKADPDLRRIPVIVLTGSKAEEDIVRSYEKHSNAYLTKPITPEDIIELVRTFEEFWLMLVELPPEPETDTRA